MNPERIWAFSPGKGEFSARTSLTLSVIKISNKSNSAGVTKNRSLFYPVAWICKVLVDESCSLGTAVPMWEGRWRCAMYRDTEVGYELKSCIKFWKTCATGSRCSGTCREAGLHLVAILVRQSNMA